MERIRFRPLALAVAIGAIALLPFMGANASTNAAQVNKVGFANTFPYVQVLPSLLPNSKENTSVVAQNDGTAAATIVMDVYTPAGVLVPSASVPYTNVPPGATRTFAQAINSGLTPGFRGVGVLSSDQPVNALLVRDILGNSGGHSYSIHSANAAGGTKVTLPFVANNFNGTYATRFTVANTGTTTACISVQYAFVDGRPSVTDSPTGQGGCTNGYAIPVNGQVAFAPTTVDGALQMPASTAGAMMAATVTASSGTITVGVDSYYINGNRGLASYDGFVVGDSAANSDLGTTILIPIALKEDGYFSQVLLSNPNATAANATIDYLDQNTGQHYTVNLSVPANGTANHSVYEASGGIPEGFIGSATVTSDQPLAAVVFRVKMTSPGSYAYTDLYSAANGIPDGRATATAKFPLVFRRAYSQMPTFVGYNTWVNVAVVGGGTANLTITSINDTSNAAPGCQAAATYTITKQITGSFVFYQNADSDNGFGANPSCFWGGMTITSDKPIIAVSDAQNDLNSGDNDGMYNAFSN